MKQQCCTRLAGKLTTDQNNLRRIARMAAKRPEAPRWREEIVKAKRAIASTRDRIIDHEAEHAEENAA